MKTNDWSPINLRIVLECFSHEFYNPHVVTAQIQAIKETLSLQKDELELENVLEVVQLYGLNETQLLRHLTEENLKHLRLVAFQYFLEQNAELLQSVTFIERTAIDKEMSRIARVNFDSSQNNVQNLFDDLTHFIQYCVKPFMSANQMWLFVESCMAAVMRLQSLSDSQEQLLTIPQITWYLGHLIGEEMFKNWHDMTPIWIKLEQVRAVFKNLPGMMAEHGFNSPFCGPSCRGIAATPEMNLKDLLISIKGVNG